MTSAASVTAALQKQFILEHRNDDVRQLALSAHRYPTVNVPEAIVQISGWQAARRKLPRWAAIDDILYPPHLSLEQCSSQLTAAYKASIVEGGDTMADLTAGFCVDAAYLAQKYHHLHVVEHNARLCQIAQNNLPLLGITHFTISQGEAEELLDSLPSQDLLYLDPARRDEHGSRVVAISDCIPDVSRLQDRLRAKASTLLIKLSPMLDLRQILSTLTSVSEIHIISVEGECKELLVKITSTATTPEIICVNLKSDGALQRLAFTDASEHQSTCPYAATPDTYLYEPNASIMKAGCFKTIATTYAVRKLSPNSHLYTSDSLVPDFLGRTFQVQAVTPFNKKAMKNFLQGIQKANLTVRNFPQSVNELRKRLKLSEGGDTYLFATTLLDNTKVLIKTSRVSKPA